MRDQIVTRIFTLLAIFGLVANAVGLGYLIANTVVFLTGI